MTAPVIQLDRHGQPGYHSLAEIPQRGSVAEICVGTGYDELDQLWKLYPGQFTICTGVAGHGKSTMLLNVVCNVARNEGMKSFLYVPENEGHIRDKLRLIWGSRSGFEGFSRGQCFVQSGAPAAYDSVPKTLNWVLDRAVVAVDRDGVDLLLIDPWNELERAKPKDMLLSDYIGQCLMYLKQFCRALDVAVILVAHPTKAGVEQGKTPTLADIEGCYSDDTETLTRRGWLHHGQLTLSDEVACFNPETGTVEYHQPSRILRREHDGEMCAFAGYGYDLLVTPGHRMLVKPMWSEPVSSEWRGRPVSFPKGRWSFCEAGSLPGSPFTLPLAGLPLAGADPETVVIGDKSYPAAAFWRLVGWYIAEGHLGPTGLTWAQAEGELAEAFSETFTAAGIPTTVGWQEPHGKGKQRVGRWYVGNRFCPHLVAWFKENCGVGAEHKKIPAAAFELSPRFKEILLGAYIEGDGTGRGDAHQAVTVSARLRDDLMRLCVEIGRSTSFSTRQPLVAHHRVSYVVNMGRRDRTAVALRTGRNAKREHYAGLVWCLTVPTGAYFVRRNGRVSVCGNSMNWYNKCDNGLIVVRPPTGNTCRVISAKARESGSGRRGECHFFVDEKTGVFTAQPGGVL